MASLSLRSRLLVAITAAGSSLACSSSDPATSAIATTAGSAGASSGGTLSTGGGGAAAGVSGAPGGASGAGFPQSGGAAGDSTSGAGGVTMGGAGGAASEAGSAGAGGAPAGCSVTAKDMLYLPQCPTACNMTLCYTVTADTPLPCVPPDTLIEAAECACVGDQELPDIPMLQTDAAGNYQCCYEWGCGQPGRPLTVGRAFRLAPLRIRSDWMSERATHSAGAPAVGGEATR